jgi:DNA-binding PadR family transcriptional regulator
MSKNLRVKILKHIESNSGEYETIDIAPIILKSVDKVSRSNIKAVLKDLKNEGYIDGEWKDLSFLNNVNGTMKSESDINATAKITQKGLSYLLDYKLKKKQSILSVLSIISIVITLALSIYSFFLKNEVSNLNDTVNKLEIRILNLEKKELNKQKQHPLTNAKTHG